MNKLVLFLVLGSVLFVVGCTPVVEGEYKEGTYFGYVEESYNNSITVTTATIYVDDNGIIKSVFVDATYSKDGKLTTKKVLDDAYGMKNQSAKIGVISGGAEWDEQVRNFEEKIIAEQGLDWIVWTDNSKTKTDSVSGVTIDISGIYRAVNNALKQAK